MVDKAIVKSIDDLEKMPEFQCGLWYSPYVKIYTIGGQNRVAEISNYPRAYKDTTLHVRTEDSPFVVGAEDLPYPVKRLFKTYPNLTPDMEGITTQGACKGCTMCLRLWSAVRDAGYPPADIQAVVDALVRRAGLGMEPNSGPRRWGLPGLIGVECDYELYLDGQWVEPVITETKLSPKWYVPIDEQVYTDSRGNKYHVGEQATLYAGDPAPGAFPLWIESEDLPFTANLEKHEFPLSDIPGPVKKLSEAQQKVEATFEKLPVETVTAIRGELPTGKVTLTRKPADSDKQVILIKYQRVF